MNIVFLFMSQSSATPNSTLDNWKADSPCAPYYNDHFKGEGYFKLLGELKKQNIINELSVFYESNKGPGKADWIKNADCQVIPELRLMEKYIKEDTIIFVRGGFKHWHDPLLKYKNRNWIILYAANTGRQRWEFWDVVLQDLQIVNYVDKSGRYWHHFIKPIDEEMFYPDYKAPPFYDLCIGASHIHDKKGQWRTIKVLQEYAKLYEKPLKCIMPGSFRRSLKTLEMIKFLETKGNLKTKNDFDVYLTGMLARHDLRTVFNTSKYFIHLGAHGQNDRGLLEALACGTPIILGSPQYHAELMHKNNKIVFIPKDMNDFKGTAKFIHCLLKRWKPCFRKEVHKKYKEKLSFEKSCDRMKSLFIMMDLLKPTLSSKQKIKKAFDIIDIDKNWELNI